VIAATEHGGTRYELKKKCNPKNFGYLLSDLSLAHAPDLAVTLLGIAVAVGRDAVLIFRDAGGSTRSRRRRNGR